jgi:hypothetical protein
MRKIALFAILASNTQLYTPIQVLDIVCKSRCRSPNGYVSGAWVESRCWCADPLDPSKFDSRSIIFPKKLAKPNKSQIFVVPYRFED